jgi:hypothetical protein
MKLSHLTLLFVAIFITIIVMSDIRTDNLTAAAEVRSDMDFYMDQAMESAVETLKLTENDSIEISNLDRTADCFFSSMYASLGILPDPVAQERLRAYVPAIVITMDNGYYIMYNDEYTRNDGHVYITRRWTELIPYQFQDNDFIYRFTFGSNVSLYDKNNVLGSAGSERLYKTTIEELRTGKSYAEFRSDLSSSFLLSQELYPKVRQQTVVDCLESDISWYVSKHNEIASSYGITYHFGLPATDESDWEQTVEGIGIIVVFQGMPLKEGSDRIYNRVAFSGAGIRKDNLFYIEQKSWYYIYHRAGCPLLEGNLNIREEHYYSVEECSKLGCYACPVCDPAGVHVPVYNP